MLYWSGDATSLKQGLKVLYFVAFEVLIFTQVLSICCLFCSILAHTRFHLQFSILPLGYLGSHPQVPRWTGLDVHKSALWQANISSKWQIEFFDLWFTQQKVASVHIVATNKFPKEMYNLAWLLYKLLIHMNDWWWSATQNQTVTFSVKYPGLKFGMKTVRCRCFWTLVFSFFPSSPGVLQCQCAELVSLGNQGELPFSKMFSRKETESWCFVGCDNWCYPRLTYIWCW